MDAEQLTQHLTETPWFIERHRARMNPTDHSFSDDSGGGAGFGPKSPTNETAMALADNEAKWVGQLARHCMNIGSIPTKPIRGFWWVNGRCRGLAMRVDEEHSLKQIRETINHLKDHVGDVVSTEGADFFLDEMEQQRNVSKTIFPQEDTDWLTMDEACELTGKSQSTIYEWLKVGDMPTLDDRWGLMISKNALMFKQAIIAGNMLIRARKARESRSASE